MTAYIKSEAEQIDFVPGMMTNACCSFALVDQGTNLIPGFLAGHVPIFVFLFYDLP